MWRGLGTAIIIISATLASPSRRAATRRQWNAHSEGSLEIATLRQVVEGLSARANAAWAVQLEARKREELEFHDQVRTIVSESQDDFAEFEKQLREDVPNQKYYAATDASREYITNWIRKYSAGTVVLDYACGVGAYTIEAAKAGAALAIGIDISGESVAAARRFADHAGVGDRCLFYQGDCENTGLPADSVDTMICAGMLHHLDLSFAAPEMRRILRPGGRALAAEALDYNPVITWYRQHTTELRTSWEKDHILSLADVKFLSRYFGVADLKYWHFLSPLGAFVPSGIRPLTFRALDAVDQVVSRIPLVQLMAWLFTFELVKRPES